MGSVPELRALGQAVDAMARALAEHRTKLLDAESRYQALFQEMPLALFRSTDRGEFLDVNRAMVELLAYPDAASLRAVDALDLYADPADRAALLTQVTPDGPAAVREHRWLRRDGQVLWARVHVRGVPGAHGSVVLEGSAEDITALRHAREELSRQSDELARSTVDLLRMLHELDDTRRRQIEAKDQFISHISHELRSPLAAIHQFLTILEDGLAGPLLPEQREYLGIALRNVMQLRGMIDELLDMTRATAGTLSLEPSRLDLTTVVSETVRTFEPRASDRGLMLHAVMASPLPDIWADSGRIRQILSNLVDNAIKFTSPGGRITVAVDMARDDPEFVRISVTDTGCGIAPDAIGRVFEPFHQEPSEAARQGLGLGLAICRELVTRQGGRIWVESKQGRGSVFMFTVPSYSLRRILMPFADGGGTVVAVDIHHRPTPGAPDGGRLGANRLSEARSVIERTLRRDVDRLLPMLETDAGATVFVRCGGETGASAAVSERLRSALAAVPGLCGPEIGVTVTTMTVPEAGEGSPEPADALAGAVETMLARTARERSGDGEAKDPDRRG
jgi:PAS domain S-box-containing protein